MLSKTEQELILSINNDKDQLINELYSLKILPNWLLSKLKTINKELHEFSLKLFKKTYTPEEIDQILSKCLEYKVYVNAINIDLDYLKIQVESVKSNSKMSMIKEKYNTNTWDLDKTFLKEELENKMLWLNSYYSILKDVKTQIKNSNDTLDKYFIVITSQMKSDSTQMLNAWRLSK